MLNPPLWCITSPTLPLANLNKQYNPGACVRRTGRQMSWESMLRSAGRQGSARQMVRVTLGPLIACRT